MLQVREAVVAEWARVRAAIDARLEEVARASIEAGLSDVAEYIARGGKRFRGFLLILSSEAAGGSMARALDAAVAIELVHSASLALDDIIDRDKERRGAVVAWIVHGLERTILTSLLMIPVAQRMVEKYGFRALMEVTRTWESTVRGEIMDVLLARRLPPSEYERVALLKTASLFRLAGVLGAIAAGRKEYEKPLGTYGEKLGLAYQLADDIVDYEKYRRGLRDKLDPSEELFARWALNILHPKGAGDIVEKALARLAVIVEEAARALDPLPPTSKKSILAAIPRFMVDKMLEEADLTLPNKG